MEPAVVIRVVLADDQPLVRAGFAMILDNEDDLEVVGQADDGAATREITAAGVKVIILTTFELDEYVFDGLRAGASGFLVKHTGPAR